VTQDDKSFLERWSRRKHAARRGEPLPEAPAAPPQAPPDEQAAREPAAPSAHTSAAPIAARSEPLELPSLESLKGLASDYKAFMHPEVDAATRSAALKKLFFDPHFNQMDGLDVYIDDYNKVEPLPSNLLRLLNQAKHLRLFDDEKHEETAVAQGQRESDVAQRAASEPVPANVDERAPETVASGTAGREASAEPTTEAAKTDDTSDAPRG
jgi:Protein of unknown function (DUF3306)